MPTNVAARMTLAADPGSLQGAVAAGILGCGPVILGTAEECARLLGAAAARRRPRSRARSAPPAASCPASAIRSTSRSTRAPSGSSSSPTSAASAAPHVALARALPRRRRRGLGPPADDERLAADRRRDARPRLPAATVKAVPILARTAGLLAHLAEEQEQPVGFLMAGAAEDAIRYERDDRRRAFVDDASSSPTCSSARRSTARSSAESTRASAGSTRSPRCR